MNYKIIAVVMLLGMILTGCIQKTVPKNDVKLQSITNIKQVEGCYQNLVDSNSSTRYLSVTLFPNKKIRHKYIKSICVKALDSMTLKVLAKNNDKMTIYTNNFIKGKDFILDSGKLIISTQLSMVNDNVLGVASESIIIGLDQNKDAKLIQKGGGAVIFPIPFAMYYSNSYRFKKIIK